MINLYYGSLRNATITEGDVTESVQYPLTNINYLSKHLTSYLSDTGSETTAVNHILDLVKIDFGSATACDGVILDLSGFYVEFQSVSYNIEEVNFQLYYSDDDTTYTQYGLLKQYEPLALTYSNTITEIFRLELGGASHRYWKIAIDVQVATSDILEWEISGTINNLYLGGFLELPCPNLQPEEWEHNVNLSTSIAGYRNAVRNQAQRDIFTNNYVNINPTYKANVKSFDSIAGKGAIPVYYEDTVDDVIMFARVTNQIKTQEQNKDLFSFSQTIEEEL